MARKEVRTFIKIEQCEKCDYWGRITGIEQVTHCCHYILREGHRRKRDGDRCLSFAPKGTVKRSEEKWPQLVDVYGTTSSGYAKK